jgi:hypothetical protein
MRATDGLNGDAEMPPSNLMVIFGGTGDLTRGCTMSRLPAMAGRGGRAACAMRRSDDEIR